MKITPTDQRRLSDGAMAMSIDISNLGSKTPEELKAIYGQLYTGAVALQSLDDLGEELNDSSMRDMDTLVKRMDTVAKKYKLLTGYDVWSPSKKAN